MAERSSLLALDESRAAAILLRVLLQKGRLSRTTYDRVAKIYAVRLKEVV